MASNSTATGKTAVVSRARPHIRFKDPKFATVIVGSKQARFVVHESLLTQFSTFFRAALTGGFKEAQDKTVTLEEDEPYVFELFIDWLYCQGFSDTRLNYSEEQIPLPKCPHRFILLHIFGNKYGIDKLELDTLNEVFNRFHQGTVLLPHQSSIRAAFDSLPETSPMCRLIVSMYVKSSNPKGWTRLDRYDCAPFFRAMWCQYATLCKKSEHTGKPVLRILDLCDYHDHKTDEEKADCKAKMDRKKQAMKLLQDI